MLLPKFLKTATSLFALPLILLPMVSALAQSSTNAILLSVPKVTKDGATQLTQSTGPNSWRFDGELTLDDNIRYSWNAVSLDLACKETPRPACGYLKIYLTDATTEQNLITEFGFSPLPVENLAPRLTEGPNTIVFVYINSTNPTDTSTQVSFTFNFRNVTTRPQITVVEPTENALFGEGIERDFQIQLTNFQLESADSGQPNRGKLNIYYNEIAPSTLVGTISTSIAGENNTSTVEFSSRDLDLSGIPDSIETKLIFALTRTNGELLDTRSEVRVRSNYQGTLDVGLPKVTITEPRKDRSNLTVDSNQKFIVQIDNFEILTEFTDGEPEDGKGYLQIIIDDDPVVNLWPKTDFSFAEISRADLPEGRKTVKVQLVQKNFKSLIPEASDSIDVVYAPSFTETAASETSQVQNNTWRIIMVILIVVLVIGGIAVLITKG